MDCFFHVEDCLAMKTFAEGKQDFRNQMAVVGNLEVEPLPLFFHKCCLTDKVLGGIPIFGQQKTLPSLVMSCLWQQLAKIRLDNAQNEIGF